MNLTGHGPMGQKEQIVKRGSALEKRYHKWLHGYQECCLSGRYDIELAHTGGTSEGKGMSRKAWLHTLLPLSRPLHHFEETRSDEFWAGVGIENYLTYAARLWDLFKANEPPHALYAEMQMRASIPFMTQILARHV